MKVDLPVNVMLRGKQFARVESAVRGPWPFSVQGRCNVANTPELWTRDGHWREDKAPHALDIVGVVAADGALVPLTDQFARK